MCYIFYDVPPFCGSSVAHLTLWPLRPSTYVRSKDCHVNLPLVKAYLSNLLIYLLPAPRQSLPLKSAPRQSIPLYSLYAPRQNMLLKSAPHQSIPLPLYSTYAPRQSMLLISAPHRTSLLCGDSLYPPEALNSPHTPLK